MTLGKRRMWFAAGTVALAASAIGLALSMPKEAQLGATIRFVTFHGASTWVSMALFTIVGAFGLAYLLLRRADVSRWEAALRYVAMPLWLFNTVLGMISSKLAWGGVNWSEPRLQASFWILIAAAVVLVIDVMADRPMVSAAADLLLAIGFWTLLLSSPNLMHPDNPVLNSGSDIQVPFFGMVATWGGAMACVAAVIRTFLHAHARGAADADDA